MTNLKIDIALTEGCNLKCSYCFDHEKNSTHLLDLNHLKKHLYDLSVYIKNKQIGKCFIALFGGEVTLNEEHLVNTLSIVQDFIDKYSDEMIFITIITTNGIRYSEGITKFVRMMTLKYPRFYTTVAISMGMSKESHNMLRSNSFDIVSENVLKYHKETKQRVIIKNVLDDYSTSRFKEYEELIRSMRSYAIFIWDYIDSAINLKYEDYLNFIEPFFELLYQSLKDGLFIAIGWFQILTVLEKTIYMRNGCSFDPSDQITLTIDPYGKLHASHLSFFHKMDSFDSVEELMNSSSINLRLIGECTECQNKRKTGCVGFHAEDMIKFKGTYMCNENVCKIQEDFSNRSIELFRRIYLNKDELKMYNGFIKHNSRKIQKSFGKNIDEMIMEVSNG